MGLFAPKRKQVTVEVLTAAGKKLTTGIGDQSDKLSGGEQWQRDAWDYYDRVGELHYAVSFFASCGRRVRKVIMLRNKRGQISPAFDDEGTALHPQAEDASQKLRELKPKIGGQSEITAAQVGNLVVTGEYYLVGEPDEIGQIPYWDVLSVEELISDNKGFACVTPAGKRESLSEGAQASRYHQPHFRHSDKADSSVRPLLDILEEIVLLTQGVRATTLSRLAGAGIYWLPSEVSTVTVQQDGTESNQFIDDFLAAMVTPIKDKGSAAAVVPMIAKMPGERIAQIRHDDFTRNFDSYPSVALRKEAIERFAQGIDLPVEIVTGQGGANHWSAWQIDESTFKAHIEPKMEIIAEADTDWLETQLGELTLDADGRQVVVFYDASELVVHPNQGQDAMVLHARYVISDARLRAATGFSDDDAPDEEEIDRRVALQQAIGQRTNSNVVPPDPAQGADEVVPGPPPGASLNEKATAAIEVTVDRAIERVGAKLRSKLNGRPAARSIINGVPNRNVANTLGPGTVRDALGEDSPFITEFSALAEWAQREARSHGMIETDPGQYARRVIAAAEELAEARLYDPGAVLPEGALAFDWVKASGEG